MIIIGLDGCELNLIYRWRSSLPTFDRLLNMFKHGVIEYELDRGGRYLYGAHSAPVWNTIFTGVPPKVHGVIDFKNGDRFLTRRDVKATYVWEFLAEKGFNPIVFGVPCLLPPIFFNCRYPEWLPATLSLNLGEILKHINGYCREWLKLLRSRLDLFIGVVCALDRAAHLWWDRYNTFLTYKQVDWMLGMLFDHLIAEPTLIISDHGMEKAEPKHIRILKHKRDHRYDLRTEARHTPESMFITNWRKVPEKLTMVTPLILEHYGFTIQHLHSVGSFT